MAKDAVHDVPIVMRETVPFHFLVPDMIESVELPPLNNKDDSNKL